MAVSNKNKQINQNERIEVVFFYDSESDYYFTTMNVVSEMVLHPKRSFVNGGNTYYVLDNAEVDRLKKYEETSNFPYKIVISQLNKNSNNINNSNNSNNSNSSGKSSSISNLHVQKNGEVTDIAKNIRIDIDESNSITTKYIYGLYQGPVEKFLSRVYKNSLPYFNNPANNQSLTSLVKLIGFLDLYLHYYYINYKDDFDYIFNALSGKDSYGQYELERVQGGLEGPGPYGRTLLGYIEMDTSLSDNRLLLYFSHELGHVVNRRSLKKLLLYSYDLKSSLNRESNNLTDLSNMSESQKNNSINFVSIRPLKYIDFSDDAIAMLDETITQDRAEDILSHYSGEIRKRICEENFQLYNGKTAKHNLSYYGEFEESAIMFGRILEEVNCIDDFEESMRKISSMALSPKFSERIIESFNRSGKKMEFYELIKNMAIIKATKYRQIGEATATPEMILEKLVSPLEARENIAKIVANINGYTDSSFRRY